MSIAMSLAAVLGKPIAERLIKSLGERKDGAQRFEEATAAMAQGLTAFEALKGVFGKEFFSTLNDVLGTSRNSKFSYEAGTQGYIRLDNEQATPIKILRDELNINLDRLTVLDVKNIDLRNQFRGLMSIWEKRCQTYFGDVHGKDIETTCTSIRSILSGETRNYRQIFELLSRTSLGGVGSLMLIGGVLAATGTGVGLVSAISLFLFGIPWLTVGALVLPGALLMLLAAKKTKPMDEISLSIALAYKLLDRLDPSK
jgi:hypothetical protein